MLDFISAHFPAIAAIVLISYIYLLYTSLIKRRNEAHEALSSIDVQLKQRFDLLPNILTIAKKFMEHEKTLLTEITELRSEATKIYDFKNNADVASHIKSSQELGNKMAQLMVAVENYPQLKSDQTMITTIQTYNETEAQISAARRFYNSAVTNLNNLVQIFPSNLIAKLINISALPFFKAEEAAQNPVEAKNFL